MAQLQSTGGGGGGEGGSGTGTTLTTVDDVGFFGRRW